MTGEHNSLLQKGVHWTSKLHSQFVDLTDSLSVSICFRMMTIALFFEAVTFGMFVGAMGFGQVSRIEL